MCGIALALAVDSRGWGRRGGVQDAPWLCPPFPASCPPRGSITPFPVPVVSGYSSPRFLREIARMSSLKQSV